jgi:hypothetical protein
VCRRVFPKPAQPALKLHPKLMPRFTAPCVRNSMLHGFLRQFQRVMWGSDPDGSVRLNSAGFGKSRLHVCRTCSLAWGCKFPNQPDGGEGSVEPQGDPRELNPLRIALVQTRMLGGVGGREPRGSPPISIE